MRSLCITILTIGLVWACDNSSGPGYTLNVSPDSLQLFRQSSVRLSVTVVDADGRAVTGVPLSFASADSRIATVSDVGLVRSELAAGRTTIRVSGGGAVADVPVHVTGKPSSIFVVPGDSVIRRSESVQYRAVVLDEVADTMTDIAINWTSNDTSIVRISATGLATAKQRTGFTNIVAQAGSLVDSARLQVATPGVVTSLVVAPADTLIPQGTSLQLRGTARDAFGDSLPSSSIFWFSDDTALATVSSSGLVQSKGPNGSVIIEARSGTYGATYGDFAFVRIATPGVPTRITLAPMDTAIASGTSAQFVVSARDAFGDSIASPSVNWASDDTAIATVSSSGIVHSEGPSGTTHIRASDGPISGSAPLTVLDTLLSARSPVPRGAYTAAISSGNVAYVVSPAEGVVRATLPERVFNPGPRLGTEPRGIAFNSTGTRAYVTNEQSQTVSSTVSVIDVSTDTELDTITVGRRPLFDAIVAPGDSILWVGQGDSVYAVRLVSKATIARFQLGDIESGMAIAGDMLYVSTSGMGTVVEFDLRNYSVARTFAVGGLPARIAVSEDGSMLYIANGNGYIQFWDLIAGMQSGPNLMLPSSGWSIARRPSNGLLYASSAFSGYLYVIDPGIRTLLRAAVIGGSTRDIAFNADGSIGIMANEGGWVDFIK